MSGGRSSSRSTQRTSQTQTLNPWSQQQWTQQNNRIQGLMDTPGSAYTGDLVAGLSDREQQARDMFSGNMGSFNGAFDTAQGLIDGISYNPTRMEGSDPYNMIAGATYNPQALGTGTQADFGTVADSYMNPYQSYVTDALRTQSQDALAESLATARGRALSDGAYGGSGYAVTEALATEQAQKNLDAQIANLLYQGYNDARGYYGSDLDRTDNRIRYQNDQALTGANFDVNRAGLLASLMQYDNDQQLAGANLDLTRAGATADLAGTRHNMTMSDIMGLNSLGEVDRGIEQDRLGMNYNEFLRQEEERWRQIQAEMQRLGMIPMLTNTSGTSTSDTTTRSSPGALGVLGTIASGASMFVPGMQPLGIAGLMSSGMRAAHVGGNNPAGG